MNVTFTNENTKFNYRIVGVVIHNGKVLFQKPIQDKYWALIGGRCQLNEKSDDSIKREVLEEIDIKEVNVDRLLWVVENFFEFNGKKVHEISLYYQISLGENEKIYETEEFDGIEEGKNIKFKWFDLNELKSAPLKPDFIKDKLTNLSDNIEHFIVVE